jgi:FKBP-type peptidyl-prolyl cis-trans isomerase SlpA
MKVEKGKKVTLEYTITTEKGELIESSAGRGGPLTFICGPDSGLLPAMLEELVGLEEDEEKDFDLPPEKAFGTIDSGPTMPLSKTSLPKDADLKTGALFEGMVPGTDQPVNFVVTENLADQVIVRLIHPLAGKTIHIKAKVLKIEEA